MVALILIGGLALAAVLYVHFLPAIIGYKRKHPSRTAIFLLNLVFGWSLIGWVVALVSKHHTVADVDVVQVALVDQALDPSVVGAASGDFVPIDLVQGAGVGGDQSEDYVAQGGYPSGGRSQQWQLFSPARA